MEKYERQRKLPGIGTKGQARIENAHVLVVGVGGLGSPAALYLARAGIGKITLCDFDKVQPSNLHRQVLFQEEDLNESKVKVAKVHLDDFDGAIEIHDEPFEAEMVADVDVVLDCTDEPGTRALIHQACMTHAKPLVWGAVEGWDAQWGLVVPGKGPCLRCLWPSPGQGPSCAEAGILGPVVGIVGVWQALAAIRMITGVSAPVGKLHIHDLRNDDHEVIRFDQRADCSACAVVPK